MRPYEASFLRNVEFLQELALKLQLNRIFVMTNQHCQTINCAFYRLIEHNYIFVILCFAPLTNKNLISGITLSWRSVNYAFMEKITSEVSELEHMRLTRNLHKTSLFDHPH